MAFEYRFNVIRFYSKLNRFVLSPRKKPNHFVLKIRPGGFADYKRLPGDDIWLFSRVLQALIFPALHYAEKKNRSILSLSDCNVTSKMPVQYHQRL